MWKMGNACNDWKALGNGSPPSPNPASFSCKNQRVGNVVSNLSRVPENRVTLLKELVSVARSLGSVSTHDLQSLGRQMEAVKREKMAKVWIDGRWMTMLSFLRNFPHLIELLVSICI